MSLWKKKKLPSGPITGAGGRTPPPQSQIPTIPSGDEDRAIKSISGSRSARLQETVTKPLKDIPPDLVQSLHTAAVKIQPSAEKNTNSADDMNTLLDPLGFHCHRLLGSGGMGSVFLATDTKLQRRVAIKVLLPRLSGNTQFTQLFLKEAETVAKFGHPNIVQVYAIHVVQNIYFIVMEYVEGTTLRDKIRREGAISEEVTLRIIEQVSNALSETHTRGIIHRDIKPQNILLTPDGIPKVADFGLAISIRESREGAQTAGTPTYMAPEQARGETPTPASDIYSLGVVMYFMLTGRIPYRASSVEQVMREISAGNKIDIKEVSPHQNPHLISIVRKSMEPRPMRRYLTMKDFNTALRNAWLSYQKRGLKPMLPRVKRAAWTYLAPPIALVAGLLMGYLVHNPTAEKTSVTYEQSFAPRVEHLKRSLLRIMDGSTDMRVQLECGKLINLLDESVKSDDPVKLTKYIGQAEFFVDWNELKPLLLKLQEHGGLTGAALTESGALWEAAEKKDRQAFYAHRTRLLDALKPPPGGN